MMKIAMIGASLPNLLLATSLTHTNTGVDIVCFSTPENLGGVWGPASNRSGNFRKVPTVLAYKDEAKVRSYFAAMDIDLLELKGRFINQDLSHGVLYPELIDYKSRWSDVAELDSNFVTEIKCAPETNVRVNGREFDFAVITTRCRLDRIHSGDLAYDTPYQAIESRYIHAIFSGPPNLSYYEEGVHGLIDRYQLVEFRNNKGRYHLCARISKGIDEFDLYDSQNFMAVRSIEQMIPSDVWIEYYSDSYRGADQQARLEDACRNNKGLVYFDTKSLASVVEDVIPNLLGLIND